MRGILTIACALALCTTTVRAEPADPQAKAAARQVLIALRVLAYDKALAERTSGGVVTIVVVSSGRAASREERARWLAGFALLPHVKVGGRSVRVVALDLGSEAALDAQLAKHGPALMIVASDLGAATDGLRKLARARKIITLSRREDAVRGGLAIGLISGHERDEIVINLEASRAQGARFGAGLLQLARLVEEGSP